MTEEDEHGIAVSGFGENEGNYRARHDRIILNVGGRRLETFCNTLIGESAYFAACLSQSWRETDSFDPIDGSYFIDLDPDVFQDVLNYLRLGNLPIFYNQAANAFNYERYSAVLAQARYLGISRLIEWIEQKKFLATIKFGLRSVIARGDDAFEKVLDAMGPDGGNYKVDLYPTWVLKKVYVCPRGIQVHHGNRDRCGRQCHQAGPGEFEDERVLKVAALRTEFIYDPEVCLQS